MKKIAFIVLVAILHSTDAHSSVYNVTINGQTTRNCMRKQRTGGGADYPITQLDAGYDHLTDDTYTCGWMPEASNAASSPCDINAGDQITVNIGQSYTSPDPFVASSHKGPFMAYLTRWEQSGGLPTGAVWFKIYQTDALQVKGDYHYQNSWYIPDYVNANSGRMTFAIPSDIAPGKYLLRTEFIAYHDNRPTGRQPYVSCVELNIRGSGSAVPSSGLAAFPGSYDWSDDGMNFNIWSQPNSNPFIYPGRIPVYQPGSVPTPTYAPNPTPAPAPVTPPSGSNTIQGGNPATWWTQNTGLWDPTGNFVAVVQPDGNLVIYTKDGKPYWASGSSGELGTYIGAVKDDGNLVIFRIEVQPWIDVWQSYTSGQGTGPYTLVMEASGNLVYYDSTGTQVWSSGRLSADFGDAPQDHFGNKTGNHQNSSLSGYYPPPDVAQEFAPFTVSSASSILVNMFLVAVMALAMY